MQRRGFLALASAATLMFSALCFSPVIDRAEAAEIKDPENTLVIETKDGFIYIEMYPDIAPLHVERIKKLAREGFYDNIVFHRVIDGFMAQTGDPKGNGMGGSSYGNLPAEFSSVKFERGIAGMARSRHPDSANSQFFVMFGSAPFLNGKYTVWGKVIEGMDVVDAIKKGDSNANGAVDNPDKMKTVRIYADLPEDSPAR